MLQLTDKKNKIIIYLIFLFILSTTNVKHTENQNNYSSIVNRVKIEGLSNALNKKMSNELNNLFYENIFTIRKEEIKKVVDRYNIIEEYSVKKIYPSSIHINIKPTKFIARISNNDQLLVGANGKLIEDKKNNEILPYVFGKFNSKNFLIFKKNIEKSKFNFIDFKTLFFFPSNRWDILTNDNILIKLPEDNFLETLNLAYKIIDSIHFKNKNLIDLRVAKHLVTK
jgi:cell division protein FtsQ|tara:strand:+ start:275 stop:952 length:678 start_codon:yes stop_codon:yes gene_type:complete